MRAMEQARPLHFGSLRVASRFLLAPLAGYTNLPFRLVVRRLGGLGLATTDLVNARALLLRSRKTMDLIQTCPEDRPLAVQIYGSDPGEMRAAAQWLEEYGVSSVDINMGCPVHKVTKGGGGSAMMCDPGRAVALVRAVVEAVRIPVTVKMRLGWDDRSLSAPFFAREFEQAGVAAVTVHGRTREQGFGGSVNRAGIRAVVEAVERIPVVGNGDVRTIEDAAAMFAETGCAAVAIGRGALLNPWVFAQLRHWEATGEPGPEPGWEQRLDFMGRHFRLLVECRGEHFGCLTFRKVANWYCRVLRAGREAQQRLVMIGSVAEFEEIVAGIRQRGAPPGWDEWVVSESPIKVPGGPVERW
ncbi:MAG TPA: tRNA dihydrouridine synthase DusB [Gemmataceae bacterium]|nr:tRNA dihydrouridine synthase DusB [Gemmataceae bacterium]